MKHKFTLFYFLVIFLPTIILAQSPYIPRGNNAHFLMDRIEILQLSDTFHMSSINNLSAKQSIELLSNVWEKNQISEKDRYNILHTFSDYIEFLPTKSIDTIVENQLFISYNDIEQSSQKIFNNHFDQKPILKYFYKTPANFLQLQTPSFQLYINPILNVQYGNESSHEPIIFQNTRGVEARGYIDEKVYFYTQLLENQRSFQSFLEENIEKDKTIPGQGFYKSYQSGVVSNLKGYDYFTARAYVGFNIVKSINLEFGHGNHFIGNGYRSLLLSDFSHNYFYLRFNTKVWKFHYQNIFAEISPIPTQLNNGDFLLPKKYMATHYLAYKPSHNFEIGLYETVVFSRINHFEFQYLNPIILYRAVEHFVGSPDNVLVGLNIKWNFLKRFSLYGQLLADEFKMSEVLDANGWWANKFGAQIGLKYINVFGIDQLDLQLEYNAVRPYTYGHRDTLNGFSNYSVANFSNHGQPLAHPLGANFREFVTLIRYKPSNKINILAKAISTLYGSDPSGENWGRNIFLPLESRQMDFGNKIGQGIKTNILLANLDIGYEVFHNYFVDLKFQMRTDNNLNPTDRYFLGGGIRVNIADIGYDY